MQMQKSGQRSPVRTRRFDATLLWGLLLFIASMSPAMADQPCFTEAELKQFLADGPGVVQWLMESGRSEELNHVCRFPDAIHQYPDILAKLESMDWQADRFAYILSRLVVGYKAAKMGPKGEQKVSKLEQLKDKVNGSRKLEPSEKERLTCQIDNCLVDIRHTLTASKRIAYAEKYLMYTYRKELNEAFENKLPMLPINLPKL